MKRLWHKLFGCPGVSLAGEERWTSASWEQDWAITKAVDHDARRKALHDEGLRCADAIRATELRTSIVVSTFASIDAHATSFSTD